MPESVTQPKGKRSRFGDVLKTVVFLGIGVFFIYWFLIKLEPEQKAAVWRSFVGADYGWVAVAMGVCLLSHLVRALRWRLLFAPMGFSPKVGNTFGSVVVAYLTNLAFPRAGEVVRCATLRTSEGIPLEKSLGTVVTERLVDALAFAVVVVVGLLVMFGQAKDWLYNMLSEKYNNLPNMAVIAGVSVGLAVLALAAYKLLWKRLLKVPLFKRIDGMVRGMVDGLKSIFHLGGRRTAMFIVYSIVIYLLYIAGGLIIFQAFGETRWLGVRAAFVVYLFGTVGMTFSQGGIGVYPVLVQVALGIYGIGMEVGTACGWLLWGCQQAIVVVVGAGYLIYFGTKKLKLKNETLDVRL
ncbi:MAG: flippase-like domain-containing protein [Bacteroidales bacterium]|nr:flippase-like domain-containing protein [Bacteroidales bacterium]